MGGVLMPSGVRLRVVGAVLVALAVMLTFGASARAAGEYEPNDSRDTAYGPLAGGTWYTATFETDNDVDWYVFYIKSYSQMDFSAGVVSSSESCCPHAGLNLYDKDGKSIDSLYSGGLNEVNHLYLTLTPGRYYLEAENYGYTGDRYKFSIEPAASITTSRECGEAIVAKDSVGSELDETNQELAKKSEALAVKAAAVHEAKKDLRHAGKKVRRLRAKVKRLRRRPRFGWYLRRTRAKLQEARYEVRRAVQALEGAKERRRPVWEEKRSLEAIAAQHQQEIAAAEGQIAASC